MELLDEAKRRIVDTVKERRCAPGGGSCSHGWLWCFAGVGASCTVGTAKERRCAPGSVGG